MSEHPTPTRWVVPTPPHPTCPNCGAPGIVSYIDVDLGGPYHTRIPSTIECSARCWECPHCGTPHVDVSTLGEQPGSVSVPACTCR